MPGNSPVKKLRYGGVEAAIWENQRESLERESFSVTLQKIYKKKDDTWGETQSFDERDLPTVAKAANDAHSWIQQEKETRKGTDHATPPAN